jgi:signal recognition particle receptor subunit beta
MTAPRELKLLFAGPMGAGKTTAIRAISDIPPVSTEAENIDRAQHAKAETTVGMDYGETSLEGGEKLRLYGLPGQARFDFMWKIVARGALGVVLLVDNSRPQALSGLGLYLDAFDDLARSAAVVIGVGRLNAGTSRIADYAELLRERGLRLPVFAVDVRQRDDVLLLLEALLQQIEAYETVNS